MHICYCNYFRQLFFGYVTFHIFVYIFSSIVSFVLVQLFLPLVCSFRCQCELVIVVAVLVIVVATQIFEPLVKGCDIETSVEFDYNESAKYVLRNTRKCTHNGLVSVLLK